MAIHGPSGPSLGEWPELVVVMAALTMITAATNDMFKKPTDFAGYTETGVTMLWHSWVFEVIKTLRALALLRAPEAGPAPLGHEP